MSKLVAITAPSGAGKTTIVRHLLASYEDLAFPFLLQIAKKREHEKDGTDYYFLSTSTFKKRIEAGDFLEWEEVYENQFYGTLKSEVDRIWESGRHIVFDIEVKGATNIKKMYGDQALVIFVRPPSLDILVQRLKDRKTESEASLKKRIARIKEELTYENSFDTVLVNDVLEVTLKEAELMIEDFLEIDNKPTTDNSTATT